ncbi:FG-GAP-like repeat-containing protein [Ideonella sp. DXS29W]|uniref:FG-GAP-like repeat-containing protein n=1 Tax=Ideonella lacteola TaxID=2984193 RepID=A0ABU9BXS2_9BURK
MKPVLSSWHALMAACVAALSTASHADVAVTAVNAQAPRTGATPLSFVVERSGDTSAAVSFRYKTVDGSARAGRDYVAAEGTATIPAGQTRTTVAVTVQPRTSGGTKALQMSLQLASPSVDGANPSGHVYAESGSVKLERGIENAAVADFNGDGLLDVAASGPGRVYVLGNGTPAGSSTARFAQVASYEVGFGRVRVADINRDGRPDMVVSVSDRNQLHVLINTTATGSFSFVPTTLTTTDWGWTADVAFADFDGDGIVDIAASNPGSSNAPGTSRALVWRNTTPVGSTTPVLTLVAMPRASKDSDPLPQGIAAGDLNGDGKPDLVIDNQGVSVLLNTTAPGGPVSFAEPVWFPGFTMANQIGLADTNRDGRLDIVTSNSNGWVGSTWSVLRNATTKGATTPKFKRTEFLSGAPFGLDLADMDQDGFTDVLLSNLAADASNGGAIEVHRNLGVTDGAPSFQTVAKLTLGDEPHTVAAGDFNRDGWPDLIGIDNVGSNLVFRFQQPAALSPRLTTPQVIGTITP